MTDKVSHLICVGASAGGITAIKTFLSTLPSTFKNPIVFVQHIKSDSHIDYKLIFGDSYFGKIVEVTDKTSIEYSTAYFSPASYHLLLEKDWTFSLTQDPPVCHSRPSIDVFFESATFAVEGSQLTGIVLTGANEDGAQGLRLLEEHGACIIVQDPEDAEFAYMPSQAIKNTKQPQISKLRNIAELLCSNSKEGTL